MGSFRSSMYQLNTEGEGASSEVFKFQGFKVQGFKVPKFHSFKDSMQSDVAFVH